jgi:hypothetical protein
MTARLHRSCWLLACALAGCADPAKAPASDAQTPPPAAAHITEQERAERGRQEVIERDFPLHGLVTSVQLKTHKSPSLRAITLGWLRMGARVRLGRDAVQTSDCARGFYPVVGSGYVCAGEGIAIGDNPPTSNLNVAPAAREAPLPYAYYFVHASMTPEFHRVPSRDEMRAVNQFISRYNELKTKNPKLALKLLAGEAKKEPPRPEIVRRFMDRAFFIASTGTETKQKQTFVRTVRGTFVRIEDVDTRRGSNFHGVALEGSLKLPLAWAVRAATSFIPQQDDGGPLRLVSDAESRSFERLARVPWSKREHVGNQLFHKLNDGHYLKSWYVAVAEQIERPKEIKPNEPWVHVNLAQQTLVVYHGDTPVYATLVSTGIADHETKAGLFEVRSKHVSTSMSDIGPDVSEDQRYSIDDVPWTQYFSGSLALHAAFWHGSFGIQHSHGCVNLSPIDAHWLFDQTWPQLPASWHAITAEGTGLRGSKVWITEN